MEHNRGANNCINNEQKQFERGLSFFIIIIYITLLVYSCGLITWATIASGDEAWLLFCAGVLCNTIKTAPSQTVHSVLHSQDLAVHSSKNG